MTHVYKLSFSEMSAELSQIGDDLMIQVRGGEKPHIGCVVIAEPRTSLTGEGSSCTSSVINVTGHKDEEICRYLAETVCKAKCVTVVCTGGFHVDGMKPEQIKEVLEAVKALGDMFVNE